MAEKNKILEWGSGPTSGLKKVYRTTTMGLEELLAMTTDKRVGRGDSKQITGAETRGRAAQKRDTKLEAGAKKKGKQSKLGHEIRKGGHTRTHSLPAGESNWGGKERN